MGGITSGANRGGVRLQHYDVTSISGEFCAAHPVHLGVVSRINVVQLISIIPSELLLYSADESCGVLVQA